MVLFRGEEALFDIEYLPLRISLRSMKRAELPPYLGSTLRGVIGQALYHTDKAFYDFLYENGKNSEKKQDIVKPYIIVPPAVAGSRLTVDPGEELNFDFILLGEAAAYVHILARALQKVQSYGLGAKRYPFSLSQIINVGEQRLLWKEGIYYEKGGEPVKLENISCPSDVTGAILRLCTPLRIRRDGSLVRTISCQTLIRNITNRVTMITERYGGWVNQDEVKRLQELAAEIVMIKENLRLVSIERFSNRLQKKMDFSGLLGEVEYAGDLMPFVPWMLAAQILHIGRNTTFGMGRIQVYFY